MKQVFPTTGASGSLARFAARYAAAQESRPGLPHGWARDGQAKLAPASQLLGPSTHYPASSANAPASICEGVLHRHHVSSLHREGCVGEKKMDVCFLPYLICFAYICMLAIEPFALRIPFASCRSFASQSWRVCMCVCVCGGKSKIPGYAI